MCGVHVTLISGRSVHKLYVWTALCGINAFDGDRVMLPSNLDWIAGKSSPDCHPGNATTTLQKGRFDHSFFFQIPKFQTFGSHRKNVKVMRAPQLWNGSFCLRNRSAKFPNLETFQVFGGKVLCSIRSLALFGVVGVPHWFRTRVGDVNFVRFVESRCPIDAYRVPIKEEAWTTIKEGQGCINRRL